MGRLLLEHAPLEGGGLRDDLPTPCGAVLLAVSLRAPGASRRKYFQGQRHPDEAVVPLHAALDYGQVLLKVYKDSIRVLGSNYYVKTFVGMPDDHAPDNRGDFYWVS